MQLPPPDVFLSWPAPNYDHPTDVRGPELLVLTFILYPIALVVLALRIFTRVSISKSFGIDDLFLLLAIIPTTACTVVTCLAIELWGFNRHVWDVPPKFLSLGLKFTIAVEAFFVVATACTKLSLLILTRRVMAKGTGILRHIAAAVMVVVACEAFILCVVVTFNCRPVSAYWTFSVAPQHCINERLHLFIGGTINTLTDFLVVALPLPTVFKLRLHGRQRIILHGLFSAGFVVCIAGIARIAYTWKAIGTWDRTWESYGLWLSSVTELYLSIICTSIPACKPFFSLYFPGFLGSSLGNSRNQYQISSSAPKSNAFKRTLPKTSIITQEHRVSQSSEHYPQFELQNIPMSKFSTRINSKNLLMLTSLDYLTGASEHNVGKREESHKSSRSSFIGGSPSEASQV